MQAKDIMKKQVITVAPTMTVKHLAAMLLDHQISGAPVAAKNGKLIGVVSEADIVAKKGKDVRSIMSKKVIRIMEDTTLEEIARLMITHAVKRLPVVDGDNIVGIVSRADIVSAIARGENVAIRTPIYDL